MNMIKVLKLCLILVCLLHLSFAQQIFQHKGRTYDAKVTIHRARGQFPQNGRPSSPRGPWRQGDRITKQEVIQNLAKALLTPKLTTEEKHEEKRNSNARKLEEYALQEARQAKRRQMASQGWNPPQPQQHQQEQYLPPNPPPQNPSWNVPQSPNQRPQPYPGANWMPDTFERRNPSAPSSRNLPYRQEYIPSRRYRNIHY